MDSDRTPTGAENLWERASANEPNGFKKNFRYLQLPPISRVLPEAIALPIRGSLSRDLVSLSYVPPIPTHE